jgi:hypothetical protein
MELERQDCRHRQRRRLPSIYRFDSNCFCNAANRATTVGAYAHIEDVVMSEMNSVYDPNIQIIVRNYGQTPARCITNIFKHCVLQLPQKPDFSLGGGQVEELCDLAPAQKTFSTFRYPHPQWQFFKDPISKKAMIFYVFGRIRYRDVFGRRRKTEYRFRLLVDATGIKDESSLVIDGRSGNVTT